MEIQQKKYQSCDTIETGCPVLDSVHLYILAGVTEVILEQINYSRAYSQPYNLRPTVENFAGFQLDLKPLNSAILD